MADEHGAAPVGCPVAELAHQVGLSQTEATLDPDDAALSRRQPVQRGKDLAQLGAAPNREAEGKSHQITPGPGGYRHRAAKDPVGATLYGRRFPTGSSPVKNHPVQRWLQTLPPSHSSPRR